MPEPTDMIVPMLQRNQSDISEMKQDYKSVDTRLANLEERFEAMGPYVAFTMGLHAQNRADVERHDEEIKDIKRRLDVLETEPT
jgi:tetrahydromethanopterin S-methyltransferase subunit G